MKPHRSAKYNVVDKSWLYRFLKTSAEPLLPLSADPLPLEASRRDKEHSARAYQDGVEVKHQLETRQKIKGRAKNAASLHPSKSLQKMSQQDKGQAHQGSAVSLLNAVTAELDNFEASES